MSLMPGMGAGWTLPWPHSPLDYAVSLPTLSGSHHPNPLPPSCPWGEPLGHLAATRTQRSRTFLSHHQGSHSPPCQAPGPSLSHQPPPRSSKPPRGAWPAVAAGAGCRPGGHAWPAALAASPPSGSAEAHFVRRFLHPAPSPRRGGGSARGQAANCSRTRWTPAYCTRLQPNAGEAVGPTPERDG